MTFTGKEIEDLVHSCTPEEQEWIAQQQRAVAEGRMSKKELETVLTMLRDVKRTGGGLVPASLLDFEPTERQEAIYDDPNLLNSTPPLSFAIEPDPPLTFEVGE